MSHCHSPFDLGKFMEISYSNLGSKSFILQWFLYLPKNSDPNRKKRWLQGLVKALVLNKARHILGQVGLRKHPKISKNIDFFKLFFGVKLGKETPLRVVQWSEFCCGR